jgi:hypothetical protein
VHVPEVRNDELMDSITRQAAERGIAYAAIVALIGAVDSFTVSTTPASDPTAHTYFSYPLPAEMTATSPAPRSPPSASPRLPRWAPTSTASSPPCSTRLTSRWAKRSMTRPDNHKRERNTEARTSGFPGHLR